MTTSEMLNVHPLLCDRTRLSLMAYLAGSEEELEFVTLRDRFNLTQGNLSSHMRKLEEAGLITVSKSFVGRKPKTTLHCTKEGRKALENYLQQIENTLRTSLGTKKG